MFHYFFLVHCSLSFSLCGKWLVGPECKEGLEQKLIKFLPCMGLFLIDGSVFVPNTSIFLLLYLFNNIKTFICLA